jgi:ankyrin repeat protein
VRVLLARGARHDLQNKKGRMALHVATRNDHTGIIDLLCSTPGAEVDAQDNEGFSPLLVASIYGHEDAVRTLLARGARQELQDSAGRTALHWAIILNRASIVELLCAAPGAAATLSLPDDKGCTPLEVAAVCRHTGVAAALRAHGAL